MKQLLFLSLASTIILISSGCERSTGENWENVKTAGRYLHKGFNALWGKDYDSQLVASEEDFLGPVDEDFIPLRDDDLKTQLASDIAIPQPKRSLGGKASGVPGIDRFNSPRGKLASIFRTINFETDNHVVREHEDLVIIAKIVNYMKKNLSAHLIIEGHCDERAPADYNMALGMRRANHIRVLLVKQGIDFNRVYTVSQGKEQPIALGHSTEDWRTNRRAEFKLYQK